MTLSPKTITLNDASIAYRRGGAGYTLLFLHGAGGAGNALGFCETLTDQFDVIVPDHPGFGDSDTPDWLETIHDLAFFYLDFMHALDLNQVHVVGQSLGGWIALETAIRSTQRTRALTVVGAAGLDLPNVPKGDLFSWDKETRYRKMIHDQNLADKLLAMPTTAEQDKIAIKNEFTTTRLAWEPRFCNPHLRKWLHRISIPTQVIWGDHDPVFPLPYGEEITSLITGAELSVIDACGHLPQIEHPETLAKLIRAFSIS